MVRSLSVSLFGVDAQQSVAHTTGTTRSIYAPSFDALSPDADAPRLTHPGKERPRLRKNHFIKRPVIACDDLVASDDDASVNQPVQSPAEKTTPYVVISFLF